MTCILHTLYTHNSLLSQWIDSEIHWIFRDISYNFHSTRNLNRWSGSFNFNLLYWLTTYLHTTALGEKEVLRYMFRAIQCQFKSKRKFRAIALPSPSIFILSMIIICLAPKLWKHPPTSIFCGEGDSCSLGQFSSAIQKRKNVSELLSAFEWTDDDVEMDRQLIDLVRDFYSRDRVVHNQNSHARYPNFCLSKLNRSPF